MLSEQSSLPDKITQYSSQDYIIGESSKGLLQKIAHRFNNDPNPVQTVPMQTVDGPEIQRFEIDSVPIAELEDYYPVTELNADNFVMELDADNNKRLPE